MTIEKPYFMTNKKWYKFDYSKRKYVLTDDAPDDAKKSYKEFYEELENSN